jgi:hypothetical protein
VWRLVCSVSVSSTRKKLDDFDDLFRVREYDYEKGANARANTRAYSVL